MRRVGPVATSSAPPALRARARVADGRLRGTSAIWGPDDSFDNEDIGFRKVGVFTQSYGLHTEVLTRSLEFRALHTTVPIDGAAILSQDRCIQSRTGGQPIGKVMLGAYFEAASWRTAESSQYPPRLVVPIFVARHRLQGGVRVEPRRARGATSMSSACSTSQS